jgi:hypothetical protein
VEEIPSPSVSRSNSHHPLCRVQHFNGALGVTSTMSLLQ